MIIAKLVNQRYALALLRNKLKLRELSPDKNMNESLGPSYKSILGKCNTLPKNKYITSFYTVNGIIKIICEASNGNVASVVNHEADLLEICSKDIANKINNEREAG